MLWNSGTSASSKFESGSGQPAARTGDFCWCIRFAAASVSHSFLDATIDKKNYDKTSQCNSIERLCPEKYELDNYITKPDYVLCCTINMLYGERGSQRDDFEGSILIQYSTPVVPYFHSFFFNAHRPAFSWTGSSITQSRQRLTDSIYWPVSLSRGGVVLQF